MKPIQLSFILICCTLFQTFELKSQVEKLSESQKVSDFDTLCSTLNSIYPYFGVNKRKNGINWLNQHDIYLKRISKTQTDEEFLYEIVSILDDLNCHHVDILPTLNYNYYFKRYRLAAFFMKSYKSYVTELKKGDAKKKHKYWRNLYEEIYGNSEKARLLNLLEHDNYRKTENNIEIEYQDNIVVLRIKSFLHENIKQDKEKLVNLYNNLLSYENLLIDIQGNGGGSMAYWMKLIVPYLLIEERSYTNIIAFRNSQHYYRFAGEDFSTFPIDSINLDGLPPELKTNGYLFRKINGTIFPNNNSVSYAGNIYLLVDNEVYSSSESFAVFCKKTGFAYVAGHQTSGDGIGQDPFLLTLPQSGIVIRYTGEMGLNADGSSSEEMGTIPDIILKGSSKKERLDELINYIGKK